MTSNNVEIEVISAKQLNVDGYWAKGDDEELLPVDEIPSVARDVSYCSCCCSLNSFIALCRRHLIITTSSVFLVLSVITFMLLTCAPTCIVDPYYFTALTKQNYDSPYRVVLLGDSLISGDRKQNFGEFPLMAARIGSFLPHYSNLNFLNFGSEGDTINSIRLRLGSVLSTPADAVILIWDSDVSQNLENSNNINYIRHNYLSNLTYVITAIQQNNPAVRIAIGGPGLLGEGPLFGKVSNRIFQTKRSMLDDYSIMNQQLALALNVTYIDIRKAYLSQLPSYRLAYSGCLTIDGEHENDNGLRIISKLVAKTILDYIPSV